MKKFIILYICCFLVGCSSGDSLESKIKKLEKASLENNLSAVEELIQEDVFFSNEKQAQEVIAKVISYGYDEVAEKLIDEGEKSLSLEQLLSVAIYTGESYEQGGESRALISQVLHKVKDINKKDKEGNTALLYAIEKGNVSLVKEIEKKGGDFSAVNKRGEGVIFKAVYSQNPEMITYVFKKNPVDKEVTADGSTPLIEGIKMGQADTAIQLIERGRFLDQQDKEGKTALMYASEFGLIDVVNALLNKGVNSSLKSATNESAYDYAVKWGNQEVVETLKGIE